VGKCYFLIYFYQAKTDIPEIKSLIYLGKNLNAKNRDHSINEWFFQDAKSFLQHGRLLKAQKKIQRELLIVNDDILA